MSGWDLAAPVLVLGLLAGLAWLVFALTAGRPRQRPVTVLPGERLPRGQQAPEFAAFVDVVAEEADRLWGDLPAAVRRGLEAKWGAVTVRAAEEPDLDLHPESAPIRVADGLVKRREVYGDFVGLERAWACVGVYQGPIERMAPETGLTTREHVRRVLRHEFAHAAGMRHEDLGPYGI